MHIRPSWVNESFIDQPHFLYKTQQMIMLRPITIYFQRVAWMTLDEFREGINEHIQVFLLF